MTRALYAAYSGPLYAVRRLDNNRTADITPITPGGLANASAQDAFCAGTGCVVQRIYDQSPRANHLDIAPPGGAHREEDRPVNATRWKINLGGRSVYGAYFEGGQGYRIDISNGVARGNDPETLYMVTSGTHVNGGCCFDYGESKRRRFLLALGGAGLPCP